MEDRRVLATIDLAALTAEQGATIFGATVNEFSGRTVSDAGDVNGDGFLDILIGTGGNGAFYTGECYLVFGGPDSLRLWIWPTLGRQAQKLLVSTRLTSAVCL